MRRRGLVPMFLLAVGAVLAACGSDATSAPPGPPPGTSEPSSVELGPLPGSTRGGAHLKFGQEAVVTVGVGSTRSRVGVIVTSVNSASAQDIAALNKQLPGQLDAGEGIVLIEAVMIDIDGMADSTSYSGPDLQIVTDDGEAGGVDMLGIDNTIRMPDCTVSTTSPPSWQARGARDHICRIGLVGGGQSILGVSEDLGQSSSVEWLY